MTASTVLPPEADMTLRSGETMGGTLMGLFLLVTVLIVAMRPIVR